MTIPFGTAVPLRFALFADLMILFGLPAFALHAWRGAERRSGAAFAARRWIAITAAAGLPLSTWALLAMVAGMADQPITLLDPATVGALVSGTAIGWAFCARTLALGAALLAGVLPRLAPAARLWLAAAAGGIALGSLAWTGHGAMDQGGAGWAHLIADILHLLAAGIWIGALVALLVLAARDLADDGHHHRIDRALRGFSSIGTLVVAVLTVTGAVNVWILLLRSGEPLLPFNPYRMLLAVKLALFAAMLGLAGINRWLLAPRLSRRGTGLRASLLIESALGAIILLLVARLGSLAPLEG